jgi:hypothetical protein
VGKVAFEQGGFAEVFAEVVEQKVNKDLRITNYRDFIIQCEDNGILQSRHRVILLGVREDCARADVSTAGP